MMTQSLATVFVNSVMTSHTIFEHQNHKAEAANPAEVVKVQLKEIMLLMNESGDGDNGESDAYAAANDTQPEELNAKSMQYDREDAAVISYNACTFGGVVEAKEPCADVID